MEHRPEQRRFVMPTESGEAFVEYAERGESVLDLLHTVVPSGDQGEGAGSALVRQVLDYARERDLRVVPTCPFVKHWLAEHPDYGDVVARA